MPVHERPVGETVEWYTPPGLFESLGMSFDLDPASPGSDIVPWVPADRHLTRLEDGTREAWHGRVWLNPPYGPEAAKFVARMVSHQDGLMLLPARTETRVFQQAAGSASAVCFLRERLHFIRHDGHQARSSFASVLFAYGLPSRVALIKADLGWTV